jgi:hypothetical protein
MGSILSDLRRIKNTTRFGNATLGPAWDMLRTLRRHAIQHDGGVLRSVARLSERHKSALATAYAYRARAEIALDVACAYSGGDYFEFGSAGLCTFRSFLAAFDINSGTPTDFQTRGSMLSTFLAIRIKEAGLRRPSEAFLRVGAAPMKPTIRKSC